VLATSVSADSFSLTIPGKSGRNYTLQRAPSPAGPWQSLISSGPLPLPREVILTDPARLPERGFYRVMTSKSP